MEAYAATLRQLEHLFSNAAEGLRPASSAGVEAALREAEKLVNNLQDNTEQLKGGMSLTQTTPIRFSIIVDISETVSFPFPSEMETSLQTRLMSISQRQLDEGQDIQNIAETVDDIKQQQKTYNAKVEEVQTLMEEMRVQLQEAKSKLRSAVRHQHH